MAKQFNIKKSLAALSRDELVSLIILIAEKKKDNEKIIKTALEKDQDDSPLKSYKKKIISEIDSLKKPDPKVFSGLRKIVKEFRTVSKDKNHTSELMFICLDKTIEFVKMQKQCDDDFIHGLADMFNQTLEYSESNKLFKKYKNEYEQILEKAGKADSDLYEELTSLYSDYFDV